MLLGTYGRLRQVGAGTCMRVQPTAPFNCGGWCRCLSCAGCMQVLLPPRMLPACSAMHAVPCMQCHACGCPGTDVASPSNLTPLPQADKAWAIYRRLVPDPQQAQLAQQGSASGDASGVAAAAAAAPATAAAAPSRPATAAPAAAPGTAARASGGGRPTHGEQHAWEGRLAVRQRELDSMAAQLVRDLRLDALPLEEYAYGALLTALSRVSGAALRLPWLGAVQLCCSVFGVGLPCLVNSTSWHAASRAGVVGSVVGG